MKKFIILSLLVLLSFPILASAQGDAGNSEQNQTTITTESSESSSESSTEVEDMDASNEASEDNSDKDRSGRHTMQGPQGMMEGHGMKSRQMGQGAHREGFMQGGMRGPKDDRMFGALPFGRLNDGSTVTVNLYDADPAEGGSLQQTLSLTLGQDSESSFAQSLKDALAQAAFADITISPQTRTIDLSQAEVSTADEQARGPKMFAPKMFANDMASPMLRMRLMHLDEASTLEAVFYDANPDDSANPANELSRLNFVAGQDSELAFVKAFETASETAAFVKISTSEQHHQINLADMAAKRGGSIFGRMPWNQEGQEDNNP
ncbi:MAG: hypothetical protein R2880_10415 [Deinococcales bacterium]